MNLLVNTAATLYQERKFTIGKAIQLSGMSRHEFEKYLAKKSIPISNLSFDDIMSDVEKLKNI
jgi:predicted HTH domain antitoxin